MYMKTGKKYFVLIKQRLDSGEIFFTYIDIQQDYLGIVQNVGQLFDCRTIKMLLGDSTIPTEV